MRIRKAWTLWFNAWIFLCPKLVYTLLLFSQSFSAKTKCKLEFPDYSSWSLIISKLNKSVHAFFIRTVICQTKIVDFQMFIFAQDVHLLNQYILYNRIYLLLPAILFLIGFLSDTLLCSFFLKWQNAKCFVRIITLAWRKSAYQ